MVSLSSPLSINLSLKPTLNPKCLLNCIPAAAPLSVAARRAKLGLVGRMSGDSDWAWSVDGVLIAACPAAALAPTLLPSLLSLSPDESHSSGKCLVNLKRKPMELFRDETRMKAPFLSFLCRRLRAAERRAPEGLPQRHAHHLRRLQDRRRGVLHLHRLQPPRRVRLGQRPHPSHE